MSSLETIPLIGSLHVERFRLENGLELAVVRDPTTPIFTYQTWFKVGSADEPAGKQGLAHLFEHMMFRKTSKRDMGEWERQVGINGGTGINAYTSRDQTVYFFTFPNDKLSLAAELEVDRMTNLVIDDDMFETEKGAVLTERNRSLDNPGRFLWEEMYKAVYRRHNYKYSIIGEEESIKKFTVEEAKSFYENYYSPSNALIVVIGDVDPTNVFDTISTFYSSIPQKKIRGRELIIEKELESSIVLPLTHHRVTQKMAAKAWLTGTIIDSDYPALTVAASLLSGQKTSILYRSLVNTGKSRTVHSDVFVGKDNGTFELYTELSQGEDFDVIESMIGDAISKLTKGDIEPEHLQIVKNMIEQEFYSNVSSPSSLARFLGEGFIYANDLALQMTLISKMKEVTISDIEHIAKKYLIDRHSVTIRLSPTQ